MLTMANVPQATLSLPLLLPLSSLLPACSLSAVQSSSSQFHVPLKAVQNDTIQRAILVDPSCSTYMHRAFPAAPSTFKHTNLLTCLCHQNLNSQRAGHFCSGVLFSTQAIVCYLMRKLSPWNVRVDATSALVPISSATVGVTKTLLPTLALKKPGCLTSEGVKSLYIAHQLLPPP